MITGGIRFHTPCKSVWVKGSTPYKCRCTRILHLVNVEVRSKEHLYGNNHGYNVPEGIDSYFVFGVEYQYLRIYLVCSKLRHDFVQIGQKF